MLHKLILIHVSPMKNGLVTQGLDWMTFKTTFLSDWIR